MKKIFTNNLLLGALVVFAIVFTLSNTTVAQEAFESSKTGLEAQMQELVKTQNKFFESFQDTFTPETPWIEDVGNKSLAWSDPSVPPNGTCNDGNATQWPSSHTWKNAPWSPYAVNLQVNSWRVYSGDINGDGLVDFMYSFPGNPSGTACTWMNNGAGWDLVYKCQTNYYAQEWTFYGDCADTEAES